MEKERLDYFRKKLLDEKKRLIKILRNMNNMEEYGSMDNYYTEQSQYDNHPGDMGTEVFMREQDEGFKNNFKNTLREIDESLKDIREGSYGICKECKEKIYENRLEAIPYVKTCLKCSEEHGAINESLDDDYVTKNSYNPKEIQYDREDTYQDLLEFDMVPGDPSFSTGDYMGLTDEQNEDGIIDIENISQKYYDDTLK
jgi:YteA family regulatory protein